MKSNSFIVTICIVIVLLFLYIVSSPKKIIKPEKLEEVKPKKLQKEEEIELRALEEDTMKKYKKPWRRIVTSGTGTALRSDSIEFYKGRILKKGDVYSYNELRVATSREPESNFLFWALVMANRYNYPSACVDVARILANSNGYLLEDVDLLDKETQEMCIKYLKKGMELGNLNAKYILKHIETGVFEPVPVDE